MDNKPAYVSVEYRRETDAETMTLEGWLTHPAMDDPVFYITPTLDYDSGVIKIGLLWSRIVSITPAQSVREYDATHSPRAIIMHQPLPKNWREEMIFKLQKEIDRNDG